MEGLQEPGLLAAAMMLLLALLGFAPNGKAEAFVPLSPRIEAGSHTALIRALAADSHGHWLASAADDRSVRIWEYPDARQTHVIYVPAGSDPHDGRPYAVAMNPNGSQLAFGGYTRCSQSAGFCVWLHDRDSGILQRTLDGLPQAITALAWTGDGRLAVGTGNGELRIYDPADGRLLHTDRGEGPGLSDLAATGDGRLLSLSFDGRLRLYRRDGDSYPRIAESQIPEGSRPGRLAISPDGERLAIGDRSAARITLLDMASLRELPGRVDTTGFNAISLPVVCWSRDGRTLHAAGRDSSAEGRFLLISWKLARLHQHTHLVISGGQPTALLANPDGMLIYAAADASWGSIAPDGRVQVHASSPVPGFVAGALQVSADARRVSFERADASGTQASCFDLTERHLGTGPCMFADDDAPPLPGRIELAKRSTLIRIGPQDSERWRLTLPEPALAARLAGLGEFVVVTLADGSLRWYADRGNRAEEVLALYPAADPQHWLAWTPEGFFDASDAGGEAALGYVLPPEIGQPAQYIRISQLRHRFLNPDLIAHRLDIGSSRRDVGTGAPTEGDLRLDAGIRRDGTITQALGSELPPQLRIVGEPRLDTASAQLQVTLEITGQDVEPASLQYSVNGGSILRARDASPALGEKIKSASPLMPTPTAPPVIRIPLSIPVSPGEQQITLQIANRKGLESRPVTVTANLPADPQPGQLHVLAIGISRYATPALLKGVANAAADAKELASRMVAGQPGQYTSIQVQTLIDSQANLGGIKAALLELANRLRSEDVLVLYLSGHGTSIDGRYLFLAQDAEPGDEHAGMLREEDLLQLLSQIPSSRKLVLLDTCASGTFKNLVPADLDRASQRLAQLSQLNLIAASSGPGMALEGNAHGIFTTALIEGLSGKAANQAGEVWLETLALYMYQRVPQLSMDQFNVKQTPTRNLSGESFLLPTIRNI